MILCDRQIRELALAALLGVSPATLRHIETGERRATEPVRRLLLLLGSEKTARGVRLALQDAASNPE